MQKGSRYILAAFFLVALVMSHMAITLIQLRKDHDALYDDVVEIENALQ